MILNFLDSEPLRKAPDPKNDPHAKRLLSVGAMKSRHSADGVDELEYASWYIHLWMTNTEPHKMCQKVMNCEITASNHKLFLPDRQSILREILALPAKVVYRNIAIVETIVGRVRFAKDKEVMTPEEYSKTPDVLIKGLKDSCKTADMDLSLWDAISTWVGKDDKTFLIGEFNSAICSKTIAHSIRMRNGLPEADGLELIHRSHFVTVLTYPTFTLRSYAHNYLKATKDGNGNLLSFGERMAGLSQPWPEKDITNFSSWYNSTVIAESGPAGKKKSTLTGKPNSQPVPPPGDAKGKGPAPSGEKKPLPAGRIPATARTPSDGARRPRLPLLCTHCGGEGHARFDKKTDSLCGLERCSKERRDEVFLLIKARQSTGKVGAADAPAGDKAPAGASSGPPPPGPPPKTQGPSLKDLLARLVERQDQTDKLLADLSAKLH
jgi:hypothetical protein